MALSGPGTELVKDLAKSFTPKLTKIVYLQTKNRTLEITLARVMWMIRQIVLQADEPTPSFPKTPGFKDLASWFKEAKEMYSIDNPGASLLPDPRMEELLHCVIDTFAKLAFHGQYSGVAFCSAHTLPSVQTEDFKQRHPQAAAKADTTNRTKAPPHTWLSPVELQLILITIARHPKFSLSKLATRIHDLRDRIHLQYLGEKKANQKLIDLYVQWEGDQQDPSSGKLDLGVKSISMGKDASEEGGSDDDDDDMIVLDETADPKEKGKGKGKAVENNKQVTVIEISDDGSSVVEPEDVMMQSWDERLEGIASGSSPKKLTHRKVLRVREEDKHSGPGPIRASKGKKRAQVTIYILRSGSRLTHSTHRLQ